MIILDKPFVSHEMTDYINETQVLVLKNDMALKVMGENNFNLIESDEFAGRYKSGERIYTVSENSLEWIYRNILDNKLISCINMMKDKVEFRRQLKHLYPDFYFEQVGVNDLKDIEFEKLPLPIIMKPSVGFFSVGVYTIQNKSDWREALEEIRSYENQWKQEYPDSVVSNKAFILEKYIKGDEYAIDAYYDENGKAVILNIMKHDFSSDADVSDRLYYTSKEIVEQHLELFSDFLNKANQAIGAADFPVHAEIRMDQGQIIPIEFNPMRFAGWCCTDLVYFAFGFRTYDYYLNNKKPDWEKLLAGKEGKLYTLIVLNKPSPCDEVYGFDYDALCKKFRKVICMRKINYHEFPTFGFLFTETEAADAQELDYIIHSDLREFISNIPGAPDSCLGSAEYCFLTLDIENRSIKCTYDPDMMFNEDGLRILQVLQAASVLDFSIDKEISESIIKNKELLMNVAGERIRGELDKLLCGEGVGRVLREYADIIAVIMPEIAEMFGFPQDSRYHKMDVWEHTIKTVESIPREPLLRITMLLHDISKPETFYMDGKDERLHFPNHPRRGAIKAVKILGRLKYDQQTINIVQNLIFSHDGHLVPKPENVKRWLNLMGPEMLEKLLLVKAADALGKKDEHLAEKLANLDESEKCIRDILTSGDCFKLEDLAIGEADILALGVPNGEYIGMLRNRLFELVINGKFQNDRESLLVLAGVIIYRNTQTDKDYMPMSEILGIVTDDNKKAAVKFLIAEARAILENDKKTVY